VVEISCYGPHSLRPPEVVVLGDRADAELAAARSLGMEAIQVVRPGVVPSPDVRLRIAGLEALPELLTRLRGTELVHHWQSPERR
jgi:methionine salvage enolase-phosphatase E1